MTESSQLLQEYAIRGSETAFRELVGRYVDFVFSVAIRRVNGDTQLAEEIVQTVFTDLARQARQAKSPLAKEPCAVGGWLHKHTCFVASNFRRAEQRRQTRERIAVEMNSLEQTGEPAWKQLAPVLDDVINELGPEDRDAILQRFYERRDLRAVGAALGVSEDAAQKRVSRGIEKLRVLLSERGITLSLGALATLLTERAVTAAPAYLALTVSELALAAGVVAAGAARTGGLSAMLVTVKAKVLAGVAAAGLVLIPLFLWHIHSQRVSMPTPAKSAVIETASASRQRPAPVVRASNGSPIVNGGNETGLIQAAPFEGLRLTILAADSGQPVPNVTLDYWCWEKKATRKKLQGTSRGTCDVPCSRTTTTQLRLTTQIEGFADTRLHWQPDRGEQIPFEYTLRLARPVSIGGTVVDADGQLVANAKVGWNHEENPIGETRPENHWFSWIEVETDAAGHWSINRIAEEVIRQIYGGARHSEYAQSKPVFASREPEAEKQLRAGTHVFQLGRALVVRGTVVDPTDQPVPGAKVIVGRVGESSRREGTTGLDGTFAIAGCKLGENLITASAAGFAPTTMKVQITEASPPFRIQLGLGKTLWLRVVDKVGQPVADANVWYNTFDRGPVSSPTNRPAPVQVEFSPKTDAQGRAVWENAPDQELMFDFYKQGYMRVSDVRLRPDGQEHEVTLPPALTISGTVNDASTGKPIPRFRLVCGWPENNPFEGGTRPQWSTLERFWVSFEGGTFRHTLEEPVITGTPNRGYLFKFEAENYAPFISRVIAPDEGEVGLKVELQRGQTATITVLLPDGRPAVNADIGLVTAGAQLRLTPGGFDRRATGGSVLSTDAEGRVRLPPDEAIQKIVAVHALGYAEAATAALGVEATLRLQPWGRIEGVCWSSGKPIVGREMLLGFVGDDFNTISFDFQAYRVTTDAQGQFIYAKVPPGRLNLIQLVPEPQTDGHQVWTHKPLTTVDVRPGETTQVELGKSNRTVRLRLRWPDGWQRQTGWRVGASIGTPMPFPPAEIRTNQQALQQWQRQNQALLSSSRSFPLQESGDGSWTADDLPPGSYLVLVFVSDTNSPAGPESLRGHFATPAVVPDDSSSSPLDLGELPLQPAAR